MLDYVCELDVHERQVGAVLRRHGHSPTPTMRASATPQEHAGLDEIECTPSRPSLPKARRRARTAPRGQAGTNVPFSNGMDDEDAREPPISTDEESDHVSIRTTLIESISNIVGFPRISIVLPHDAKKVLL